MTLMERIRKIDKAKTTAKTMLVVGAIGTILSCGKVISLMADRPTVPYELEKFYGVKGLINIYEREEQGSLFFDHLNEEYSALIEQGVWNVEKEWHERTSRNSSNLSPWVRVGGDSIVILVLGGVYLIKLLNKNDKKGLY